MSEENKMVFSNIHRRYDLMNSLFSLGIDSSWRKEAAAEALLDKEKYRILDTGCGTGELTIALLREAKSNGKEVEVEGIDINDDMLEVARKKINSKGLGEIKLSLCDALNLNYKNSSFDVVTSAFALRNFDDLDRYVGEVKRVLKKDGKFVFLEMGMPEKGAWRYFFRIYLRFVKLGGRLTGKNAYSWLVYSIMNFDKKRLHSILREKGFRDIKEKRLTTQLAYVVSGRRT